MHSSNPRITALFKVQAACWSRKHNERLCADWNVYNEVALERNSIRVLQRSRLTIIYAFSWRALWLSMQQYNSMQLHVVEFTETNDVFVVYVFMLSCIYSD